MAYKYLGASMVVDADHPAVPTGLPKGPPGGRLTYGSSANKANAPWHGHLARESQGRPGRALANSHGRDARVTHGRDAHATPLYDQAGNNPGAPGRATYRYDGLDRLIGAKRGILPDTPYQAPYPADATLDGAVDAIDLGIFTGNWQQSGKTWTQADFNGDGKVDAFD